MSRKKTHLQEAQLEEEQVEQLPELLLILLPPPPMPKEESNLFTRSP